MHTIITNICVWFKFILEETFESVKVELELEKKQIEDDHSNRNINKNVSFFLENNLHFPKAEQINNTKLCTQSSSHITNISKKLNVFLVPCAIEYCIICVTLYYGVWTNIKSKHLKESLQRRCSIALEATQIFLIDCNKSLKGLFAGLLIFLMTIIVLIVFIVSEVDSNMRPELLNLNETITLKEFGLFLTEIFEVALLVIVNLITICALFAIKDFNRLVINNLFYFLYRLA
jgi:hypothetical protein